MKSSPRLKDGKPKARFVVRDKVQAPPPRRGWASRLLGVTLALTLAALGGMFVLAKLRGPDQHFLRAQKLVRDYEFGKPKKIRNYEHPTYAEALDELAQVNPRSRSAEDAEAMRIEIERDITEFRTHQQELARKLAAAQQKQRRKERFETEARYRGRAFPVTEFPECEGEDVAHSGDHKNHTH